MREGLSLFFVVQRQITLGEISFQFEHASSAGSVLAKYPLPALMSFFAGKSLTKRIKRTIFGGSSIFQMHH